MKEALTGKPGGGPLCCFRAKSDNVFLQVQRNIMFPIDTLDFSDCFIQIVISSKKKKKLDQKTKAVIRVALILRISEINYTL